MFWVRVRANPDPDDPNPNPNPNPNCDSAHCRTSAYLEKDEARRDEAWPSQVRAPNT